MPKHGSKADVRAGAMHGTRGVEHGGPHTQRADKGAVGPHAELARKRTVTLSTEKEDMPTLRACTEREGKCEAGPCT